MASVNLNKWIVSGNLAADVEIKTVTLKNGEAAEVAKGTLYVQRSRNREAAFTVSLSIWRKSSAWRVLPYLKKGSFIICTGDVDVNPFISRNGNVPKAGLAMTVLDINLISVRNSESSETSTASEASQEPGETNQYSDSEPLVPQEEELLAAAFPAEF
jgi:single-strand DNA-binding protein